MHYVSVPHTVCAGTLPRCSRATACRADGRGGRELATLTTERLLIRPFTRADADAAIALFTDPGFMAGSLEGGALSASEARAKLEALIALQQAHGFSKLALIQRGDQRLIGYCGFGLELIDGRPLPEFGYRLLPDARGRGLATEAARAILAVAFTRMGMSRVHAIVEEDNALSLRVMEKLGMKCQRRVYFHGREWLLFRLDRPS